MTRLKRFLVRIRHLIPNNVLPPQKLLNEIFDKGKSNTADGNHLIWNPFRIGALEYRKLTREARLDFGPAPKENAYKTWDEWFEAELMKRRKRLKIVKLRVGSKIKMERVPKGDLLTEQREKAKRIEEPGWTAQVIREIIRNGKPVKIYEIDEYGNPWFRVRITRNGKIEEHILAVMDNKTWKLVQK